MTRTLYDLLEWSYLWEEPRSAFASATQACSTTTGCKPAEPQETDINYPTKTAPMVGFDAEDDATLTQDRSRELEVRWSRPQ